MEVDDNQTVDLDPVVKEIPIYLSKRLEKQLYVFQYPFRPKLSKTELAIEKSYLKPDNKEVKLEMGIDTSSSNFDITKAEQIAMEVDGMQTDKNKDKEVVFENEYMDKIILTSSNVVQNTDKYAIGVFNGKEYHISPLEGFLQMKPCLDYLNKVKRKRDTNTDDEDDPEAGPSAAEAVTVKFSRNRNDKQMKSRDVSYKKLKEKRDAESWIECKWNTSTSSTSEITKQKLFSECFDDIGQGINVKPSEYIKILVPDDKEEAIIKPSLPSNVVSLHALRALPLLEQCRLLLKDAKIIQFQQLIILLAGCDGATSEALLKTLPQVAVLVRGNWIVKSEILYPQDTFSAVGGVPAELMCRSRDYVLYLFTKKQFITRKEVCLRLPIEEIKEIFTGISKLDRSKRWSLVLPTDTDFMGKHFEVVERQQALWEQRVKQLESFMECKEKEKEKKHRRKSKSVCEEAQSKESDLDSSVEKPTSPEAVRKKKAK
ncbi:PREDICTED: DNA-directed RNA polymerase III subunit RPC5 [Nicrophorus vespilloides]|uniref:DNA-directed RNA polymerase III subunit RPC5 n=1 Tax=Nicrophorus vespilloides TaxID=110193 RepID=A0ABM1MS60_NICVS|nr:PREDICTED: DNA-directed RNA polymerase III subunit RPC5 [Nicrophorus vespilloides]XP_017777410.1 PREDICTED: DNA-directed RNA polymerase III subunit RPC5 [Nicrophorus vespilloides]